LVPAFNGPVYKGVFTIVYSLSPSPNFMIMTIPTQIAWF